MNSNVHTKPLPQVTASNAPFWAAAKRGELMFLRCSDCGAWNFPAGPVCQRCWSENLEWRLASGRGVVSSWVVFRRAFDPSFEADVPYAVVEVEVEEGVRLISNLVDVPVAKVHRGMPVQAVFDSVDDDVSLIKFRQRAT